MTWNIYIYVINHNQIENISINVSVFSPVLIRIVNIIVLQILNTKGVAN